MGRGRWIIATASLFACGGKTEASASASGSVGSGGSGMAIDAGPSVDSGGDEGNGIPEECAVATTASPPFGVVFELWTPGSAPVDVFTTPCIEVVTVYRCSDGYSQPINQWSSCTKPCAAPTSKCTACGDCFPGLISVTADAPHDEPWNGMELAFGTDSAGCACYTQVPSPAQKYRAEVQLFEDQNPELVKVVRDFELPAPNGVVRIQLP